MKSSLDVIPVCETMANLAVELSDSVASIFQSSVIVIEENFVVLRVVTWQRKFDGIGGHVECASGHGNVALQLQQSQLVGNRVLAEFLCEARLHEVPALPHRADADDTQVSCFNQRVVHSRQQSTQHFRKLTSSVDENLLAQLVAVARRNGHFLAQPRVERLLEACVNMI